jgi:hypothetical protein
VERQAQPEKLKRAGDRFGIGLVPWRLPELWTAEPALNQHQGQTLVELASGGVWRHQHLSSQAGLHRGLVRPEQGCRDRCLGLQQDGERLEVTVDAGQWAKPLVNIAGESLRTICQLVQPISRKGVGSVTQNQPSKRPFRVAGRR